MAETEPVVQDLFRVAFKPVPFWHSDPESWFLQLESQFVTLSISQELTKYHYVVSALDASMLSFVKDIVRKPPSDNPYAALKERILKHFSQSETSKLKTLLLECRLGEKRPSHLLAEMRSLGGDKIGTDMLRTMWLQRLPANTQQVLSVGDQNLDLLAETADRIHEIPEFSVSEVVTDRSEIQSLKNEVSELKGMMQDFMSVYSVAGNSEKLSFRSRSRSWSRPRKIAESKVVKSQKFCWYHRTFAGRAKRCVPPCSWSEN